MELNAYIGRAGTGKSKAIIEEIKEKMKQDPLGDPIVLIAPTQNTFQLEQAFVNDKTLNGSLRTEVLHFERLSYRVFQEVGGLMEQQLSKAGTEMMIYDIIQQHQSELRLYQSQVKYYGFSEKLYEQIQDFKKYAVSPQQLETYIAENNLQTRTKHKLQDIALVYKHLEDRINGEYVSTEDSLQRFIEMMDQSEWLKRAEIYIDGFHNFSTLEYQIIQSLVKYAKKVTIVLTTDGDRDLFSLFRKPSESLTHIEEIANNLNIQLHSRQFLDVQRFIHNDLKHLEQNFNALQFEPIPTEGNVEILEASGMREEINEVARRILRENREQGRRFQDIAILYRDESYAYLMESILPQYDIPYNIDVKSSMTHHPIMEMIRSLIEVIQTGWQFDPLMRLFKTNILTKKFKDSQYLIDILENFVLERGIYGKRWIDDKYFDIEQFRKMGLKRQPLTDEERETFERVIQLKNDVMKKVMLFEEKINNASTAIAFATAFYEAMEAFDLPSQLMTDRDTLDVNGEHKKAEEIDQIWNGLIQILDDLVTVFDDQSMSKTRFLELFDIGLEQLEFIMIPQTLDQVSIGTMDLAKVDNKQHVYLVGANDGVLPQTVTASSLITDEEKKYFQEQSSIELSPTADILQMDEAFVCYIAMTRSRAHVTFSYALMGASGDVKEPSPFLHQIQQLYTNLEVQNIHHQHQAEPLRLMEHPHQTKIALFESLKAWLDDELVAETWLDTYQVMRDDTRLNDGLTYLLSALTYDNQTVQLNPSLSKALYGSTINASVSRFEGYQACPFKHFASHGLRLNERTKYKLENFDLGDIFHRVLKFISEKVNGDFKNLNPKQIHKLTTEALSEILPEVQFNLLNSTAYYRYLSQRIGAIVETTLTALKYQGSHTKFTPQRFEASFRRKPKDQSELLAAPLQTKQGIPINIRGQIDRIDTYQQGDESFVNIIDYKSSKYSGTLDLTKVYYGLQMQMMTYMDIVLQNKSRLGLTDMTKPGGLLYFHVHEPRIKLAWNQLSEDKRDTEFINSFKLSGLLNSATSVLDAFDTRLEPSYNSDIVPLGLKKDGGIKSNSKVADEQTIYKLIKHNKQNFIETASNIMDGHTEVAPMKYNQTLPCDFCNYKSVCHVDGMIDSKRYRTVDESINPLEAIQDVDLESEGE
ncbi:helicase-exonuclease AddAB subunit AddB [Staphylococcus saprophyticus]|jgi:ATP-dependent helicase/nuclease subunit B|uniref:helicase-exonuclease AddAB subunit AddB n=1 Tax=Staphylococcus TaxID=1279 RepID=UPI000646DF73|nr:MULTISPECIES: helicase-exonuclease AddAB subunit AddB [Staphylococcus]ASE59800.1 helicase-exonuclease AddAB subunit AddB [Staphylococcus saprophyticus]MBC2921640.1 helicase-exonuclease AddAB subunit AddB [Staphylococcus saprophyticus]MBC2957649.1 helicase-exonuclease AddAB subunit AddB [Staphylococcus saprophyticus]MBC3009746.1 helicase-exonuclease AddAB subunit AddB [Staphylococcus saprophyticus]MBC3023959.1 helicase-exonuclease AddAB subunit AddB [Staphylococcus saprophyticus]